MSENYEVRSLKIIVTFLAIAKDANPDDVYLTLDEPLRKIITIRKDERDIVLDVTYNTVNRTQSTIKISFGDKKTSINLNALSHDTHAFIEDKIESYVRGERRRLRKINMIRNINSMIESENINLDDVIKGG